MLLMRKWSFKQLVNTSTNINKTNKYISPQIIELEKGHHIFRYQFWNTRCEIWQKSLPRTRFSTCF